MINGKSTLILVGPANATQDPFFGKNIFPSKDAGVAPHASHFCNLSDPGTKTFCTVCKLRWKEYRRTWAEFATLMHAVAIDVLRGCPEWIMALMLVCISSS